MRAAAVLLGGAALRAHGDALRAAAGAVRRGGGRGRDGRRGDAPALHRRRPLRPRALLARRTVSTSAASALGGDAHGSQFEYRKGRNFGTILRFKINGTLRSLAGKRGGHWHSISSSNTNNLNCNEASD